VIGLFKVVRGLFGIAIICLSLPCANAAQMTSLLILPFSRRSFMKFNMGVNQAFCNLVGKVAIGCGNHLILTGDQPRSENAIAFANHQSMIDIIMIWRWMSPYKMAGWIRWFAKYELKYVPGLGWGMQFINTLFVKRDWSKDANSIRSTFAKLRGSGLPTWLMIFPEGTRLKPEKLKFSQDYARRKSLPVMEHVLIPRGKGFSASLQGLDGVLQAVYDLTFIYQGPIPSLYSFFTEGGCTVRLHSSRYEISDIPRRDRDLNAWLLERFMEKDQQIKSFEG
jgi:lysocardiolipin and lysophospholipid acyltransferase